MQLAACGHHSTAHRSTAYYEKGNFRMAHDMQQPPPNKYATTAPELPCEVSACETPTDEAPAGEANTYDLCPVCGVYYLHKLQRQPTPPVGIRDVVEPFGVGAHWLYQFDTIHTFTYLQFETEHPHQIALWADAPLFDFSFVSLDVAGHDWVDGSLIINTREVLFTVPALQPGDAVVLHLAFAHYLLPHGAIVFTDEWGVQWRMFLHESMRGGCFPVFNLSEKHVYNSRLFLELNTTTIRPNPEIELAVTLVWHPYDARNILLQGFENYSEFYNPFAPDDWGWWGALATNADLRDFRLFTLLLACAPWSADGEGWNPYNRLDYFYYPGQIVGSLAILPAGEAVIMPWVLFGTYHPFGISFLDEMGNQRNFALMSNFGEGYLPMFIDEFVYTLCCAICERG